MMSKEAIAHYEAALKEAFPRGATGEVFHHWNEARYLIATEALDRMAENARELGLDYDVKSDDRLMEQPAQQEPVAKKTRIGLVTSSGWDSLPVGTEFYTSPPAQRKPLTSEEIWKFWWGRPEVPEGDDDSMEAQFVAAARAVLAAHGIKE